MELQEGLGLDLVSDQKLNVSVSSRSRKLRSRLHPWYKAPLVVHYWADLQSVHGFRYYDIRHICKLIALYTANAYSAECEMSASACTRSMAGSVYYFVSFCARQNNFHVVFCCPSHRILATPLAVED